MGIARRLLGAVIASHREGNSPPLLMNPAFGIINTTINTHPFVPRLPGEIAFSPCKVVLATTSQAHSAIQCCSTPRRLPKPINGVIDNLHSTPQLPEAPLDVHVLSVAHSWSRVLYHGPAPPASIFKLDSRAENVLISACCPSHLQALVLISSM